MSKMEVAAPEVMEKVINLLLISMDFNWSTRPTPIMTTLVFSHNST